MRQEQSVEVCQRWNRGHRRGARVERVTEVGLPESKRAKARAPRSRACVRTQGWVRERERENRAVGETRSATPKKKKQSYGSQWWKRERLRGGKKSKVIQECVCVCVYFESGVKAAQALISLLCTALTIPSIPIINKHQYSLFTRE